MDELRFRGIVVREAAGPRGVIIAIAPPGRIDIAHSLKEESVCPARLEELLYAAKGQGWSPVEFLLNPFDFEIMNGCMLATTIRPMRMCSICLQPLIFERPGHPSGGFFVHTGCSPQTGVKPMLRPEADAPRAKTWIDLGLGESTDVQLREECVRRGWKSNLTELTDDQLRAECNRRWGEDDCPMAKTLRHERDELERRAQSAEADLKHAVEGYNACGSATFKAVQTERDTLLKSREEWFNLMRKHGLPEGVDGLSWLVSSLKLAEASRARPRMTVDLSKVLAPPTKRQWCHHGRSIGSGPACQDCRSEERRGSDHIREAGPGIASVPSLERRSDVVDLATMADLLCEDA